jgi:hypothetical protein
MEVYQLPGRFIAEERAPRYQLDRTLGGPQNRSEHYTEEKKSLVSARHRTPCSPVRSPPIYRLSYLGSK